MKAIYSLFFLLIVAASSYGQEVLENQNDGPYVLYQGKEIVVSSIGAKAGASPEVFQQRYKLKDKAKVLIQVSFTDHPGWNFEVKLQSSLHNEPVEFKQPDRLLALSDIEGEFEALRKLLLSNKVIDEQYNWIFGNGHLVICGDLFDRGSNVPATLWLLYKLEQEAKAKGGYLHTILGNHDIMNLSGDLRYVKEKYMTNARLMNLDYMDFYSADAELGRWLRTKNLIEKIGDNLCLHAGVAPVINAMNMSLAEINEKSRPFYDKAKKKELFTDMNIWKFFDGTKSSLFWYRGYFVEPKATEAEVDQTLALYKVKRIIVGHTITESNVGLYYNGKVLGIDVNQHKGKHEGALYEQGKWYKVGVKGEKLVL